MVLTVFYLFNIILSKIKITDMEKEKNKIHINKFAEVKTKNIGSNTIISAFAFIDKEVVIGNNCIIGEGVVIKNKVIVEDNCFIGPNTSIGLPAEWKNNENISLGVVIKSGTRITGHVTIDSGVLRQTMIGKNCYLMKHSHVGHDCIIEDEVVLSANATLAGHVHVMRGANLGIGVLIHQYMKIGEYVMLGMGSIITKKTKILPGGIYVGSPAKFLRMNHIALEKHNVSPQELEILTNKYNDLYDGN